MRCAGDLHITQSDQPTQYFWGKRQAGTRGSAERKNKGVHAGIEKKPTTFVGNGPAYAPARTHEFF
jgi:hypothetical protein